MLAGTLYVLFLMKRNGIMCSRITAGGGGLGGLQNLQQF